MYKAIISLVAGTLIFGTCFAAPEDDVPRDPALFTPDGHYTEKNLFLNILPREREGRQFPLRVSEDVVLSDISAGPGSVITNVFRLSKKASGDHTPYGVLKNICQNQALRSSMVDRLDSYRFIYYEEERYLFSVDVTSEHCKSNGW